MTVGMCLKNASLTYRDKPIFAHLSLTVPASKRIALLGPPCIGKSGFLRMIAGKANPEEKAFFQISSDNNLPVEQQSELMTTHDGLRSWLTILDNVLINLQLKKHSLEEQMALSQRASAILEQLNMSDIMRCYPHQLTPHMRQQVALIRTLLTDKPIILMDSPFTGLDPLERMKLNELAAELFTGKTIIFITQEPTEALRYANEIFVMQGDPVELHSIASFSTPIPRELSDPQLTAMYTTLFSQIAPVHI